jgi:two-component system response regulator LytT
MIPVVLIDHNKRNKVVIESVLKSIDPAFEINHVFSDTPSSFRWFDCNPPPYLVICELDEKNNYSDELIDKFGLACPFIYTGKENSYQDHEPKNAVGFIKTPASGEEYYHALQQHCKFSNTFFSPVARRDQMNYTGSYKKRILVRKSREVAIVNTDDVAYFFSENHVSYLVDRAGRKFFLNDTLVQLQKTLDPAKFFRACKKYLVHIDSIVKFKVKEKGQIELDILPQPAETILISSNSAVDFNNWVQE